MIYKDAPALTFRENYKLNLENLMMYMAIVKLQSILFMLNSPYYAIKVHVVSARDFDSDNQTREVSLRKVI